MSRDDQTDRPSPPTTRPKAEELDGPHEHGSPSTDPRSGPSLITGATPGSLATATSLEAFFFERLHGHPPELETTSSTTDEASRSTSSSSTLDPEVGAYLVQVLVAWARRVGEAGRRSPALALEFMEARARDVQSLRRVGDRALCIAGIVPRSMTRSPVNLDYVSAIGRSAYSIAAHKARTSELFTALADRFDELADRLGEAAAPEGLSGGLESVLDAYARWQRSRTASDGARLIGAGVVFARGRERA